MNFHGGDIYKYKNQGLLDFSSNINPMGVPESFKKALLERIEDFTKYPDIDYIGLKTDIGDYLGVQDIRRIVPGNGAVELLYKFIAASGCERVYTISPTFSEYGRAARQYGMIFEEIPALNDDFTDLDADLLLKSIKPKSLLVLCNPNNPTGTLIGREKMCFIVERLALADSVLIVDEAFMEFTDTYPHDSMIPLMHRYPNLIIIKAATKFFGMPGIRLGYGMTQNKVFIKEVEKRLEPWNINTTAVIAASVIFKDTDYIESSRAWIMAERPYLFEKLGEIKGLKVYPSRANFHLIKLSGNPLDAWKYKEKLVSKGILIRPPDGFNGLTPYHIRLAVKDRASNNQLLKRLKEVPDIE